MTRFLSSRYIVVYLIQEYTEFQDNFMPFFAQERKDLSESLIVKNATQLFNSACCLSLGDFQWNDLTLVGLPNTFKHFVLDADELKSARFSLKTYFKDFHL